MADPTPILLEAMEAIVTATDALGASPHEVDQLTHALVIVAGVVKRLQHTETT